MSVKVRLIPTLLFKNTHLVKTVQFQRFRPVGIPVPAVKVYNQREVDELVFLDISATPQNRGPRLDLIAETAEECFMPMAVGGGVRTLEDIRNLLKVGADKVVINTEALERPEFITESAGVFGRQCIVVSIDVKRNAAGKYEVFARGGTVPTGKDPVEWAQNAEALGAGEILLTSIDRDGMQDGYDVELIRSVASAVGVPVIASGGVGKPEDFAAAVLQGHASAVAAASLFHFSQHTPLDVKAAMKKAGINVRL